MWALCSPTVFSLTLLGFREEKRREERERLTHFNLSEVSLFDFSPY